jgi:hypothetical protein
MTKHGDSLKLTEVRGTGRKGNPDTKRLDKTAEGILQDQRAVDGLMLKVIAAKGGERIS